MTFELSCELERGRILKIQNIFRLEFKGQEVLSSVLSNMSAAAAPRSKGASTKSTGGGHIGMLPIKAKGGGKLGSSVASGLSGVLALCFCLVCVRWCRRRRFYKKVRARAARARCARWDTAARARRS
jgi:hypothetical protein